MNITVRVIDHKLQRHDTVGDWFHDESGNLYINVSAMGDWRHEMLVAFHEIAEALCCKEHGVRQMDVDHFDRALLAQREKMTTLYDGEPGDHPEAPYRREHFFATTVERLLAAELGVDWSEYDAAVNAL